MMIDFSWIKYLLVNVMCAVIDKECCSLAVCIMRFSLNAKLCDTLNLL
jgi:hypothetical protein